MNIQNDRLYYHDSYLSMFTGQVIHQEFIEGHWHIELNHTAFYPTSGGQPHDTGQIGNYFVCDVYSDDEQHVFHVLCADDQYDESHPPFTPEASVQCSIDWNRRFDHMQHHTGQHLLSACFEHELNVDTIGFHLGNEDVTIDIDTPEIDWETAMQIETESNHVIWSNRPIRAQFVEAPELGRFHLRSSPKVSTDIRIVTISDFDDNACGGTHVAATAEVGVLKIVKLERIGRGMRVHFQCGHRALRDYRLRFDALAATAQSLSVGSTEVPQAVAVLSSSFKDTRKSEQQLRRELSGYRARTYAEQQTVSATGLNYVCTAVVDGSPGELKPLAAQVLDLLKQTNETAAVALTLVQRDRTHLVVIATEAAPIHAGEVVRQALGPMDGKGGGSQTSGQGAAPNNEKGSGQYLLKIVEDLFSKS